MKHKGLISLMLFIAMIAALTFTMTRFQLASASPSKTVYCNSCHPLDSNTQISVTVESETESDITYYVSGSDNYSGEEGWAVFDPTGNNIANGYNPGYLTLPKDGRTYSVYWVDDADPGKGGSAYMDITTPVVGVHDIAITRITAPSTATEGDLVSVVVDLANTGDYDESFDLKFLVDGSDVETRSVTLAEGATTSETFTWAAVVGTHILAAEAVVADDATPANNYAETSIDVSPVVVVHDVAITEVTVSPTAVVEGEGVSITVDLLNEGTLDETFNVSVYYDSVLIEIRKDVFLAAGATTTLTFSWNTTAVAEGTYTIRAEASIFEGELDTADNTFTDGTVTITTPAILSVTVDFDPDTLNLKSMGKWVTCYVELPEGYDVEDINVSTILLEGLIPAETDPEYGFVKTPEIQDRDGNGIPELMVKFDRQAVIEYTRDVLGTIDGHATLTITGELTDYTSFEGSDTMKVISRGKHIIDFQA